MNTYFEAIIDGYFKVIPATEMGYSSDIGRNIEAVAKAMVGIQEKLKKEHLSIEILDCFMLVPDSEEKLIRVPAYNQY